MRIGFIATPGVRDPLLAGIAETLIARGIRARGIVQVDTPRRDLGRCDMDVRVLPGGPAIRISQSLGAGAGACRLDAAALEAAVALVGASLEGAEVLILNKFGKQEVAGRGFRGLIAEAMAREIPVLLRVDHRNLAAFESFAADFATPLPPEPGHVLRWVDSVLLAREAPEPSAQSASPRLALAARRRARGMKAGTVAR